METLIGKVQKLTVLALAGMLVLVMLLSTVHLGVLIGEEVWKPPRGLIPLQGLPEIGHEGSLSPMVLMDEVTMSMLSNSKWKVRTLR